jgi:hypothetical protein
MRSNQNKMNFLKNMRKYFLEFIMIFLAVFLGFFADNVRDDFSKNEKENGYISSLIQDVKIDKRNIKKAIQMNEMRIGKLDTLSSLCYNYSSETKNDSELYKYFSIVTFRPDFLNPTEIAMLQLKNDGGISLIKKKDVVRDILHYDLQLKELANQQEYYENYQNNSINLGLRIFSRQPFEEIKSNYNKTGRYEFGLVDFKLIRDDKLLLTEFANVVNLYSGIVKYYNDLLQETEIQADSLIINLKKEYNIE